jgi:hypothetical protein
VSTPIKMGIKGLALFMTSSPARQRKVVRDYKYPNPEGSAQAVYYREARDFIPAYHRGGHPVEWLLAKADSLHELARNVTGTPGTRLRNNERALRAYADAWGQRVFEVVGSPRLELRYGRVRVSVAPELHVRDNGKDMLIKLDFGVPAPEAGLTRIVTQAIYEAATKAGTGIAPKNCIYFHIQANREYGGARMGSRTARDIEAACETLCAIWDTI